MFSSFQQIETGLSPPYDGSEIAELFPDLAGFNPRSIRHQDKEQSLGGDDIVMDSSEDEQLNYVLNKVGQSKMPENHSSMTKNSDNKRLRRSSREKTIPSYLNPKNKSARCVSPDDDDKDDEGSEHGLNRNALMARLNRQKKKQYLTELEESVKTLTEQNVSLSKSKKHLGKKVDQLQTEVNYLRGVIANQSELSSLLQNIGATSLRLHSSFPMKPPTNPTGTATRKPSAKRSHDPVESEEETDSETELSDRCESGDRRSVDHDYTMTSSKEQKKRARQSKEDHPPHRQPSKVNKGIYGPSNLRLRNKMSACASPQMTRTMQTVTTKSGQEVNQNVMYVTELDIIDMDDGNNSKENNHHLANRRVFHSSDDGSAGVCLHVSSGNVSLEFCAHCSNRAKAAVTAAAVTAAASPAEEPHIDVVD